MFSNYQSRAGLPGFVADTLLCVENPEQPRLNCQCGHCPVLCDMAYTDLALDACLVDALGLIDSMKRSPLRRDANDWLALHSLHGLITHGRLLGCVQRYAAQPGDKDVPNGVIA
jgi:hypothetical protein